VSIKDRGFASLTRDRQKAIASIGGKVAHQKGTAHEWNSKTAAEAGRKGGLASHRNRKAKQEPAFLNVKNKPGRKPKTVKSDSRYL